jgi:hypothetical protein
VTDLVSGDGRWAGHEGTRRNGVATGVAGDISIRAGVMGPMVSLERWAGHRGAWRGLWIGWDIHPREGSTSCCLPAKRSSAPTQRPPGLFTGGQSPKCPRCPRCDDLRQPRVVSHLQGFLWRTDTGHGATSQSYQTFTKVILSGVLITLEVKPMPPRAIALPHDVGRASCHAR